MAQLLCGEAVMSVLHPTDFFGEITFLGRVPAGGQLASVACDRAFAGLNGIEGEAHAGATRRSCSRVLKQYPRGTEIANTRQLSVLSEEELAVISAAMGLVRLDPQLVGASLVLRGIPDLSHLPPGSRLQGPSGATLVVDVENGPCVLPAKGIEAAHPGHGVRFKPAANGRRGFVGWIECPGTLQLGEKMRLHVPSQVPWAEMGMALSGGRNG